MQIASWIIDVVSSNKYRRSFDTLSLSLHARHIDKFHWSSIYQFHVFLYFKSFGVIDIYIGRDISLGLHIVLLIGWNKIWKITVWWECWDMMCQREFVLRMIVMIGFWYKLTSLNAGTDPRFQVRGTGDKPKKKKKTSNMHPYIINKLSTNTNTQNHCFLIY